MTNELPPDLFDDPYDPIAIQFRALRDARQQAEQEFAAKLAKIDQAAVKLAESLPPIPGIDDMAAAVASMFSTLKSVTHQDVRPSNVSASSAGPMPSNGGVFYGMGMGDASVKQLDISGRPMSPREIAAAFSQAGFEIASEDPPSKISSALADRAKSTSSDVVRVERGKWGLRRWYTADQLAMIEASLGGTPTRDADLHLAKSMQGMEAARARGVRLGRASIWTSAKLAEAVRIAQAEPDIGMQEMAKRLGCSKTAFYNKFPRGAAQLLEEYGEGFRLVK